MMMKWWWWGWWLPARWSVARLSVAAINCRPAPGELSPFKCRAIKCRPIKSRHTLLIPQQLITAQTFSFYHKQDAKVLWQRPHWTSPLRCRGTGSPIYYNVPWIPKTLHHKQDLDPIAAFAGHRQTSTLWDHQSQQAARNAFSTA